MLSGFQEVPWERNTAHEITRQMNFFMETQGSLEYLFVLVLKIANALTMFPKSMVL